LGEETVTVAVADFPPLDAVTTADPAAIAVMSAPFAVEAFTLATPAFDVDHVTVWPDIAAPAVSRTVAVRVVVSPCVNVAVVAERCTDATIEAPVVGLDAAVVAPTATAAESVIPDAVARSCVDPFLRRCSTPVADTVATVVSRVDQVTLGLDTV
jgi:hypothetical protein